MTRKICRAAATISAGAQQKLQLGDITARCDWGHARDYVHGMWMAMQHPAPDHYVFATGILHSVEDVLQTAFATVGLQWRDHVETDPKLFRLADPMQLVGDANKARTALGWSASASFEDFIREMTVAEVDTARIA